MEPLFRGRCRPASDTSGPRLQGPRVTCANYALKDIGQVTIALLFSPEDRFVGYVVYLPENQYQSARAASCPALARRRAQGGRANPRVGMAVRHAGIHDRLLRGQAGMPDREIEGSRDPMAPKWSALLFLRR